MGTRSWFTSAQPFQQEPEFAVESINYKLQELLARGEQPA